MKLLFCSSEIVPFAKTGGLADVAGALPVALKKQGVDVIVAMPKYKAVDESKFQLKKINENVYTSIIAGDIPVYFIENKHLFDREGLYGDSKGDYKDNFDRFNFYCKKTIELLKEIDFKPDIIHCNDWQTGLIPTYLKTIYKDDDFYRGIKTVFTIHNLAYQGVFEKNEFPKLGLSWDLFDVNGLEFYGKLSFLKAGLEFADLINTVSPTYSQEIQTKEFGCGLEGVLIKRKDMLFGVINGLDYKLWDPAQDNLIFEKYTSEDLRGKLKNKIELQKFCGLSENKDAVVLGFVGRLAEQKGIDLIAGTIKDLDKLKIQLVVLGTGDMKYHKLMEKAAKKFTKNVSVHLKFDNTLAHRIYAGSDMFLMPSRYEPCGLGQMISFKYGTIPIVRKTGGLADTVVDAVAYNSDGNGFVFENCKSKDFFKAVKSAVTYYRDTGRWQKLMKRVMSYDFSWDESARKYLEIYKKC